MPFLPPTVLRPALALAAAVVTAFSASGDDPESHWSFEPPRKHAAPNVNDGGWARGPIDPFLLARMESAGLTPNGEAAPRVLLRRLSFDLTGLPPTDEEARSFEEAHRSDTDRAVEELVDRLLASPQFGVRWARPWLDLARYAEDQAHIVGNDSKLFYPNAYLYRDWVIGALNEGLPYDRFLSLQLAADLVDPDDDRHHAALGFIGLGPKYYRRNDPQVMADEWEDRIDTISRGLLGLTASCARCHDHKFDPISTEDYYGLAGVFASTEMYNRPLDPEKKNAKPADAMHVVREKGKPTDLKVHLRGDAKDLGEKVPRRFLTVLSRDDSPATFTEGSGRRELAEAITKPTNALTARVFVNRIWGELFGHPLVSTPSNFGMLGMPPSHPALLDDLAVRFMENDWSIKSLVRELVLSATYRQSSELSPEASRLDPDNKLLSRMSRRRLPVEMWRDAVYAAAGTLDLTVGGKSFAASDPEANRRALYARISRLKLDPMLALFDFPDPNLHAPGRHDSTTPLQKLFALNNPLMVRQAQAFADRVTAGSESQEARITQAYRILFGRRPSDEELRLGLAFLQQGGEDGWAQYAQVLLASNEFLYLD